MRKLFVQLFVGLWLCLITVGTVEASLIIFDHGTLGSSIDNFYSGYGVIFSNTQWVENKIDTTYFNSNGTAPYSISAVDNGNYISANSPLVLEFTSPQSSVSILGLNVGFAGARMDVYNSSNTLIGYSEAYGTTEIGEINIGNGEFEHEEFLLQYASSTPLISKIELYRPQDTITDGIHFDNLTFEAVPVPASILLFGSGIAGIAGFRIRRKKK